MSAPRSRDSRRVDRKSDPNRLIYTTALTGGVLFSLGFLAALIGAAFTGDFTFGGLLVTALALMSAGSGVVGWKRRRVVFSWGAIALLLLAMALGRAVAA